MDQNGIFLLLIWRQVFLLQSFTRDVFPRVFSLLVCHLVIFPFFYSHKVFLSPVFSTLGVFLTMSVLCSLFHTGFSLTDFLPLRLIVPRLFTQIFPPQLLFPVGIVPLRKFCPHLFPFKSSRSQSFLARPFSSQSFPHYSLLRSFANQMYSMISIPIFFPSLKFMILQIK